MADSIKVRTAIGSVLITAICGLIYFDHWSGHGWGAIAIAILLVSAGLAEYARMAGTLVPLPTRRLVVAGGGYMLLKGLAYEVDPRLHLLAGPWVVAFAYSLFFNALKGSPSKERFRALALTAFGFFYLPFLGGYALDARFLPVANPGMPEIGTAAFFYTITIAKGTDMFAYFSGKLLGKTKVVPSVSPGKTVAGFVGAIVGGVVITVLFCKFSALGEVLPLPLGIGAGMLMALVGISGDLIESFIKRSVAVKDSASLLPNFGGVLDIVDSILICAPCVVFLLLAAHHGKSYLS
ncbi:MAG: phosphatidate cytidylyltransferase [Planctomycetes bacterium]|nr:phosphatidate cytidylyltransferase [Planctomycetota bacterium]